MPDEIDLDLPVVGGDRGVWGDKLNADLETLATAIETVADDVAAGLSPDDLSALVQKSSIGQASGVASLGTDGQVPASQLARVTPNLIGAAAANHQHALSDLPSVQLALSTTPIFAIFNTVTGAWPTRASLTTSTTRVVIWVGNATLPSDVQGGVDFFLGPKVTVNSTAPTTPVTPPPPATGFDANGVKLAAPTVVVNGSGYTVTAQVDVSAPKTFAFLQIAVRGPGGVSQDTAYNPGVTIPSTLTISGSGDASVTGSWSTFVAYNLTGGGAQTDWVNGPTTAFTISATGGGTGGGSVTPGNPSTVPKIGRSGLLWNSGTFPGGYAVSDAEAFGSWRGTPIDAILSFADRSSWNGMTWLPAGWNSFPGYRIWSIPSQPAGQNNSATAAGSNNAWWTAYGSILKNAGWDDGRTIIRLNWECNGNWYDWSWQNGGAAMFVNAVKNVVNSIRINAPKTIFDICMNRGNVNGGVDWKTQIYDPLINHYDIIGMDSYDWYPAQNNSSAFASAIAQDPGPSSVAAYARAKGKKMNFDEWGLIAASSGLGGAVGDDPNYITQMWDFMVANQDVMAYEGYYNDNGAPPNLLHKISTGNYPNAAAAYRASNRWGGGN